jgi:hypothetical protein
MTQCDEAQRHLRLHETFQNTKALLLLFTTEGDEHIEMRSNEGWERSSLTR